MADLVVTGRIAENRSSGTGARVFSFIMFTHD
jgi:hypothetical protein